MPGYLTQIASSALSLRPGSPLLIPTVRSRSPIAERDQRLSLNDAEWNFDNIAANETPAVSLSEVNPALAKNPIGASPVNTLPGDSTLNTSPIRIPPADAISRPSASASRTPRISIAESPANPPVVSSAERDLSGLGKGGSTRRESRWRETIGEHPRRPVVSPSRVVVETMMENSSASAVSSRAGAPTPAPVKMPEPVAPAPVSPTQSPRRPTPPDETVTPGETSRRPTGAPRVQAGTTPGSQTRGAPTWEPTLTATSPSVVIGRIDVEIVPPPVAKPVAQASKSSSAPSGPVSQIGPLGGVPSRLRFSAPRR